MFGLFKKKKENQPVNDESVQITEVESPKIPDPLFSMSQLRNFCEEQNIRKIGLITEHENGVIDKLIETANTSFIIYDPKRTLKAKYQNRLESAGYMVKGIDVQKTNSIDKIALFDVMNITKITSTHATIFTIFSKPMADEIQIMRLVYDAAMKYMLEANKEITIEGLGAVIQKSKIDNMLLSQMDKSSKVTNWKEIVDSDHDKYKKICDKIIINFIQPLSDQCSNPNVFSISLSNKKTCYFIHQIDNKALATIFLLNARIASFLAKGKEDRVLIIENGEEQWFHRDILTQIYSMTKLDKGYGLIHCLISDEIKDDSTQKYYEYPNQKEPDYTFSIE